MENLTIASDYAERRDCTVDRRTYNFRTAWHSLYRNRRKAMRRDSDSLIGVYIDAHRPTEFLIAVGIAMLSALDAYFTTILLANGSRELNPFMNYLMEQDYTLFVAAKILITGLSIVFLVMHKHHLLLNRFSGLQILSACFFIYLLLIAYEWSMVQHLLII
jgi:hypothetical protein